MIEVFKTNVNEEREANQIVAFLSIHFPGTRINFDLQDCDRILRLEGEKFMAWDVISLVNEKGFQCSVLE